MAEAVCPQCRGPLRATSPGRLDCARCGATLLLDGAPRARRALWFWAGFALVVGLGVGGAALLALGARPEAPVSPLEPERRRVGIPEAEPPRPRAPGFQREPDFLDDPEAMAALPGRIHAATDAFDGRVQHLIVDRTPVAVALVPVGPVAVDSVVFSFGQVVRDTVPLDEGQRTRLRTEVFPLKPGQLAALPALVDRVEAEGPPGVRVERAMYTGVGGPPRLELERSHPREVLPPLRFDLDGRPLEVP